MAIISGQVDLAGSTQALQDYPLYKDNEDKGNYTVLPTPHPYDHLFIVLFNENAGIRPPTITSITSASVNEELPNAQYDPGLAAIYTDVRFRRAMSLALNREVFNDTLFMGMGRPAQVSPRPNDPSFREGMDKAYAAYDPTEAKRLLDEMGLKDVNGDGWREQPNGNPFKVRFEYFIISSASTPGVELCKRFWEEVGVQTEPRIIDNTYFNQLVGSNVNEATTWWLGGANANLIQDWFFGPSMIVPLWSRYTRYINSSISQDEWNNKILPYVPEWQREMQDLRLQIKLEPDPQKQIEIGTKIWQLQAEWLPIIGVVTEAPTPLILSRDLGNVEPITDMGLNYIGVMEQAECFYFKNPARRSN
jgi:peptide/nickel transport system substrate-binding protein